ncbi:hypothetical protein JRO89_XS02G0223800 [Xanthoceras sorbifolium]|uniref:Protein kinase domain-containing protein n=1 Tax=Xanthoceras sorbifolium TaxID=99658 RepID=A0ABQ8IH94_9ROSI|nr:hypothetical protein JRO89_XS02G0223800 [Xanthoceras sorbifolium]
MIIIKEFDYEDLVKATQSFSQSTLVGKGSHGSVYKGILAAQNLVLAVKRASFNGQLQPHPDNVKKLDNEIKVLSSLRDRQNPPVVNFLGMSRDLGSKENKLLVMEFMPNGSLHDLLHVSTSPPLWTKRIEIAVHISRAVQFLHESNPSVIHRDIKSTNILFDSNWNPRLADFGLAVSQPDSLSRIQPAGTIGYLDPSYTSPDKLSTKIDVFSFGVVLLEIISGRKAIDLSRAPSSVVDWAMPLIKEDQIAEVCDKRVALPPYMEAAVRHILRVAARCVSPEEENRPEIAEIVLTESCHFIERVRFPIWTMVLGSVNSFMLLKRKRIKSVKCEKKSEVGGEISRGKIILREILAELH